MLEKIEECNNTIVNLAISVKKSDLDCAVYKKKQVMFQKTPIKLYKFNQFFMEP